MTSVLEQQLQSIQLDAIKESIIRNPIPEVFRTGNPDIDNIMGADGAYQSKITHSAPDKITVYAMKDGTPSTILVSMLAKIMQRRDKDGKKVFTVIQADAPTPINAGLLCFLHEDSPWKEEVAALGMGYFSCPKNNLPSAWQQERHGVTKHAEAWKALERIREGTRDEENRTLMRAQTQAMQAMAGSAPAKERPVEASELTIHSCTNCTRFFDTQQGLAIHNTRDHPRQRES